MAARRLDRRRLAARPAGVPELRRRDRGGRRAPTTSSTATAGRGDGTEGRSAGTARTSASPTSTRRSRGCAARRRPRRAEHAHLGDDAHRVGAGRVGEAGARGARGDGRAPSVAHDPPLPRAATPTTTGSTRGRGRALGGAGHRPRPRDRGGRAHAARRAREGAGEHRRAAAHLRPARLPPLARRAAVGRARARAARRRHRPADRRLDGVGRPAGPRTSGSRSSSRAAPPRTSRGRGRRAGARTSRRSGPGSPTCGRSACAGRRRRRGSSCGWLRSRLGRDDIALEHEPAEKLEGVDARRRGRCRSRPATRPRRATSSPTSSSASRRDPVYEAAVLAATDRRQA